LKGSVQDFLWDNTEAHRSYHLVNWETVCNSTEYGGLAIKDLEAFNTSLLGKWGFKIKQ
jgi:hypothetical protein